MTAVIDGRRARLTDAQLIASGGEGSVYRFSADEVVKVYHTAPAFDLRRRIDELAPLRVLPDIAVPDRPALSESGEVIGYVMRAAQACAPMPPYFTTSYLSRNQVTLPATVFLAQQMAEALRKIHDLGILVVDLNEFNVLVRRTDRLSPFFIDVDSYQTPSFPATAILPAVQDFASPGFSELTDWYSFGVLAFMLFIGIHPYGGQHPSIKQLEDRVRRHAWVFGREVAYPRGATRSLDDVPTGYRAWLHDVFSDGARLPPPEDPGQGALRRAATVVASGASFRIEPVASFGADVIDLRQLGGSALVSLADGSVIELFKGTTVVPSSSKVIFPILSMAGETCGAFIHDERVHVIRPNGSILQSDIGARRLVPVDDRLYAYGGGQLSELILTMMAGRLVLITFTPIRVPELASRALTGTVYADTLGTPMFVLAYAFKRSTYFTAPQLRGYRVLDGLYTREVLVVVASRGGAYERFTFKFKIEDALLKLVDHDVRPMALPEEVNATVLKKDVLAEAVGDELWLSAEGSVDRKIVPGLALPASGRLRGLDDRVLIIAGRQVLALTMNR